MDASQLVVRAVPQQGLAFRHSSSHDASSYHSASHNSPSYDPSPYFWRRHSSQVGSVWRTRLDWRYCLRCRLDMHAVEPMVLSVPVSVEVVKYNGVHNPELSGNERDGVASFG